MKYKNSIDCIIGKGERAKQQYSRIYPESEMKWKKKKGYNCDLCISLDKFFHVSRLNTEKYCEKTSVSILFYVCHEHLLKN